VKTIVYVDAFNLYYGALKDTSYRWLDLAQLCRILLPQNEVVKIKYFTALIAARQDDPHQPIRQQMYLRALKTLPMVTVVLGHFLSHKVRMLAAGDPVGSKKRFVDVIKTEEKGSDVNLATHLLCDGYEKAYDVAVVITNDSDLVTPVRMVRERLKKTIGVVNPHCHPSQELLAHASFFKSIRKTALASSQFPDAMKDAHGAFHKPASW
jgi:uncharacterized LabA/DUF88 family protein